MTEYTVEGGEHLGIVGCYGVKKFHASSLDSLHRLIRKEAKAPASAELHEYHFPRSREPGETPEQRARRIVGETVYALETPERVSLFEYRIVEEAETCDRCGGKFYSWVYELRSFYMGEERSHMRFCSYGCLAAYAERNAGEEA